MPKWHSQAPDCANSAVNISVSGPARSSGPAEASGSSAGEARSSAMPTLLQLPAATGYGFGKSVSESLSGTTDSGQQA